MQLRRIRNVLTAAMIAGSGVALANACGSDDSGPVSKVIDAKGGDISSDGFTLVVPPGALSTATEFVVDTFAGTLPTK